MKEYLGREYTRAVTYRNEINTKLFLKYRPVYVNLEPI